MAPVRPIVLDQRRAPGVTLNRVPPAELLEPMRRVAGVLRAITAKLPGFAHGDLSLANIVYAKPLVRLIDLSRAVLPVPGLVLGADELAQRVTAPRLPPSFDLRFMALWAARHVVTAPGVVDARVRTAIVALVLPPATWIGLSGEYSATQRSPYPRPRSTTFSAFMTNLGVVAGALMVALPDSDALRAHIDGAIQDAAYWSVWAHARGLADGSRAEPAAAAALPELN
jgi:hypothetical protein